MKFRIKIQGSRSAFTIVEALIAIGILTLVGFAAASLIKSFADSHVEVVKTGAREDLKNFVRQTLNCNHTVRAFQNVCKENTPINGRNNRNYNIIANASAGRTFTDPDSKKTALLKLLCTRKSNYFEIQPMAKMGGDADFTPLMNVPIACEDPCRLPVAPVMGATQTFPSPLVRSAQNWVMSTVRTKSVECDSITIANRPILRSTGASRRGKDKPFNNGTEDLVTLQKVCDLLGYTTYVSSTCQEHPIPPYDDNRCNYTSPGDNFLMRWNGTSWVAAGPPCYHMSWLATITCTGKK